MKVGASVYRHSFVLSTLVVLFALLHAVSARGQSSPSSIQQVFTFACNSSNVCAQGANPSSLIQSADGNFYGTVQFGGSGSQAAGTVFKLTSTGQLTTIYTFTGATGANPTSLVEGNDGFLYGTTDTGGANHQGVVFKLSKSGTIQVLHNFCSLTNCADGNEPFNLVLANDGNFYGCTRFSFPGTLFRITPASTYTLLHTFNAAVDGPQCIGMTVASDGNMYGTTLGGVSFPTVLFRLTPAGQVTVEHSWRYSQFPVSPPTQTSSGRLWAVLSHTLDAALAGMAEISLSGANYQEIPLFYAFSAPAVRFMTQASDGSFWGTSGQDVVSFTLAGALRQQLPVTATINSGPARMIQASAGQIIGITNSFGSSGPDPGEIFTVQPALAAPKPLFVTFSPSSGAVGSQAMIHGVHFVGTTAVKFNGVSAQFQVLNTGNIKATVPAGATTGLVTVVNPGGAGVSKKSFTVQ
jgi:uncharacterized repeat protein (TIGR03803 family)